jgi:hypothetical protein
MNEIETQANIIQIAIDELECNLPYKILKSVPVQSSIEDIRMAVRTLKQFVTQSPSL